MAKGTPELVPIAWGMVVWSGAAPSMVRAGGVVSPGALAFSGLGPFFVQIDLSGVHNMDKLQVQLTPLSVGHVYEASAYDREPGSLLINCFDAASDFSLVVFEER